MSTTVSYKGQTLTTVSNATKTLLTEGKYLEDDLTLVDVSGGGAVLGTKNITANGTYEAEDDSLDGYSEVTVAVPASAVDSGTKSITANGNNQDVVGYAAVNVNVPNSYSAGDEGKVVDNGALVAQTSDTVTENDTYDTTLINSLTVNVSGGGGSGVTLVASGEFLGDSSVGRQTISIGNKMAQSDFFVLIKAKDDSEFVRDGYSLTYLAAFVPHEIGRYDLSATGDRAFISNFQVYDNNSGTLTAKNAGYLIKNGGRINSGNTAQSDWNTFTLARNSQGYFTIYFGHSNQQYNMPSNITYEYKIVYFGNNPSTDIVTI